MRQGFSLPYHLQNLAKVLQDRQELRPRFLSLLTPRSSYPYP